MIFFGMHHKNTLKNAFFFAISLVFSLSLFFSTYVWAEVFVHGAAFADIDQQFSSKFQNTDEVDSEDYATKFDILCGVDSNLCDKVRFDGDYTDQERYSYFGSILFVVTKLNKNLSFWWSVTDSLQEIIVKKDTGNRRWYATHDTVVFNLWSVQSYDEFVELVGHELGHIVDLGVVNGTDSQNDANFTEFQDEVFAIDDPSLEYYALSWKSETVRKSSTKKDDFCSGYGMSDPFEDFAECHNLYLNHNNIFKYLASKNSVMKKKYDFMVSLYNGKYLFKGTSKELSKFKSSPSQRPWDTTRMK